MNAMQSQSSEHNICVYIRKRTIKDKKKKTVTNSKRKKKNQGKCFLPPAKRLHQTIAPPTTQAFSATMRLHQTDSLLAHRYATFKVQKQIQFKSFMKIRQTFETTLACKSMSKLWVFPRFVSSSRCSHHDVKRCGENDTHFRVRNSLPRSVEGPLLVVVLGQMIIMMSSFRAHTVQPVSGSPGAGGRTPVWIVEKESKTDYADVCKRKKKTKL